MKYSKKTTKKHLLLGLRMLFWFILGATIGLFFFLSFVFIYYKQTYGNLVYPGVFIGTIDVGGKSRTWVNDYFTKQNERFAKSTFTFTHDTDHVTTKASDLMLGYDATLLADQAYSVGRASNVLSDIYLITKAYVNGVYLSPTYHYDQDKLEKLIKPMQDTITVNPINAQFIFENGRVTEFHPHTDGKKVDLVSLHATVSKKMRLLTKNLQTESFIIPLPVTTVKPEITIDKVNNLGIKELIGTGTSLFKGSIENRIYNVNLAAKRLNGVLVKPGETFSFAKALGDVSAFTGYKQAYVIENGRTVLGDGGGVCQVSTTFFRAILAAGLPIVERNPHAYRVHYYEEDSPPGIDAAVYVPTVDLKFTNDSPGWLLIQTSVDPVELRLTFEIYGAKDGREVTMTTPVILSQSPAPEALYQDDPTLPKGMVKQIDFSAPGANVYFTRQVKKDGKIIIRDKFTSNYRPWQAIFLRGTKE